MAVSLKQKKNSSMRIKLELQHIFSFTSSNHHELATKIDLNKLCGTSVVYFENFQYNYKYDNTSKVGGYIFGSVIYVNLVLKIENLPVNNSFSGHIQLLVMM